MMRKSLFLLVFGAAFAALAAGGAWYAAADCGVRTAVVPEPLRGPFAACSAQLQQAVEAMHGLQRAEEAERVGAVLGKAFDAMAELPEPTEAEAACIRHGLEALANAWWAAGARSDDIALVYAPALLYQLYIRRTPLTGAMLEENPAVEAMLSQNHLRDASPELKREQEAWRKSVQGRHEAMDRRIYGGGNGASKEEAVVLLPLLGQEALPPENVMREPIFAYLWEVFGATDACYMAFEYNADGRYYKICNLYNGTFRDSGGRLQLRVLPVWFRVK